MEATVKKSKKTDEHQNVALTERQIKRKVGQAWAVLKNPVYEKGVLQSAELLYYSEDKAKAREQLRKCENGYFAFKFCGKIDPNIVYIL